MSLGYFNKEEEEDAIINKLAEAKILYCNSDPQFVKKLKRHFTHFELIDGRNTLENTLGISSGVYKFYN